MSGLWRDIFSSPAARRIQLEPGQALFRQNDPISSIFLVESGRLRLVRHLEDGTPVVMHTARGGETFAEGALSAEKYHCDAVAETKAQVLSLAKKVVLDHLEEHPEAGLAMVLQMARQVRDLRTRLELRNIRRADERLLAWLQLHAEGSPPTIVLDRSWTRIAEEVGLTRESVYRALRMLESGGNIRRTGDRTILLQALMI